MVESIPFQSVVSRHAGAVLNSWLLGNDAAVQTAVDGGLSLLSPTRCSGLEEETAELLNATLACLHDNSRPASADPAESLTRVCINMLAHLSTRGDLPHTYASRMRERAS